MKQSNLDWELFDILGYLSERGIPFTSSGKNVSQKFIGTACPFCGDTSNHLGINPTTKQTTCWRCGYHHIGQYIKEVENCSWQKVKKIYEQFQLQELPNKKSSGIIYANQEVKLPLGCTNKFSDNHIKYLEKRRFDPKKVIKKYQLMATNNIGKFKFRIIIPIFLKNKMVAYVGRDITEMSDIKYLNSAEENSIIPVKSALYSINPIRDTAIIVEGIFDAWRIGKGAIATFGKTATKEQILLLKGLKRVFIMYDADAIEQSHKLAYSIGNIVPYVEIIELEQDDPDSLSDQEILAFKREINLI